MPPFYIKPTINLRLAIIVLVATTLISMTGSAAYLIDSALSSMTATANRIDDTRSVIATEGALRALQKQLAATVRDNAYWDDAYNSMNGASAVEWATSNWGNASADYPLYDTAAVIEPDGQVMIAYHQGRPVGDVNGFFHGSFKTLLAAARKPDPDRRHIPVAFIRTRLGVAVISAEAIQPSDRKIEADPDAFKVLVFAKHLTPATLTEIGENFSIRGLALTTDVNDPGLDVDLKDAEGHDTAHFVWPPEQPGSRSYRQVRATVMGAAAIMAGILLSICTIGWVAVRSVRREERISTHRATHDPLTGALNRAGFLDALESGLERRPQKAGFSVLLLDLDGFKAVNDAWGHAVGDRLIKSVAERIDACLPADALVARIGGDEFAVISFDSGFYAASELQKACMLPFAIESRTIEVGVSIGVAASDGRLTRDELFLRADLALYRAKQSGRNLCVVYDASLDDAARETALMEQEIRDGLAARQFQPAFQPLIDAATGDISGVEALARWTSPSRGPVRPDVFIPAAERSGLIDQLGMQILEASIAAACDWPDHIGLSVNISPIQLRNPYFSRQVRDILVQLAFDPTRLTIEVTEGVLISNPEQAKRTLNTLKDLGALVALDDFGCGYASIGALREFGFDRMKVDRSLIIAADTDDGGGAILSATIALAHALNIPVTAEGIETERQADIARLCGCDKLQGFLFSRPVSADEIAKRYFRETSHLAVG